MSEAPIIAATYVEWKMIKTRKVLQLVFELPLEQQQDVLTRLGAPRPDRDDWYAIVRLKRKPPGPINTDDMIVDEEPREPPVLGQEGSRPPESVASAPEAASGPGGASLCSSGRSIHTVYTPDPPHVHNVYTPDQPRRSDAERRRYAAFLRAVRDYPTNPDFVAWVSRKVGRIGTADEIASYIKWRCGIDTRLDIKTDETAHKKFEEMEAEFEEDTPGRFAERRG